MKKKIAFLFLLFVFSSFFLLHKNKTEAAKKTTDPLDKYGFIITIVKYDGNENPKAVTKPILVYQKGLLDTVSVTQKGNYPQGNGKEARDQLLSPGSAWKLDQFVEPNNPNTKVRNIRTDEGGQEGLNPDDQKEANANVNKNHKVSVTNREKQGNAMKSSDLKTSLRQNKDDILGTIDVIRTSINNESNTNTANLDDNGNTANKERALEILDNLEADIKQKATDKKGNFDIDKALKAAEEAMSRNPDYNIEISGDAVYNIDYNNSTEYGYYEAAISSEGCPIGYPEGATLTAGTAPLDDVIRRYMSTETTWVYSTNMIDLSAYYAIYEDDGTAEEMARKYAGTPDKIKANFGYEVKPMDQKSIYVSVEVAERRLDGKRQTVIRRSAVHTITYDVEGTNWSSVAGDGEEWICSGRCPEGYSHENPYAPANATDNRCIKMVEYTTKEDVLVDDKWTPSCPLGWKEITADGIKHGILRHCGLYEEQEVTKTKPKVVDPEMVCSVLPCKHGQRRSYIIYGIVKSASSSIVPSTKFADKARNSCRDNKHCTEDINGNCIKDQPYYYYVGPNVDNGLVVPRTIESSDKTLKEKVKNYKLPTFNDAIWRDGQYVCLKKDDPEYKAPKLGIQYFYFLPEYWCSHECSKVLKNGLDKSSDEYLNCAEQYADSVVNVDTQNDKNEERRRNARKKKWNIIITECGYTYGESPDPNNKNPKTAADRESVDSYNNSLKKGVVRSYVGQQKNAAFTSSCNVVNGKYVPSEKGVNVSDGFGDNITDFNGDVGDTIFDHRTYVNKICKSTTDFEYKDTSQLKLSKGGGFTYPIEQEGEKECTYFFNREQWKVDYASAPSRDPSARARLNYILNSFNAEAYNGTPDKKNVPTEEIELYGKTNFTSQGFNFGETQINTKVKEYTTTSDKSTNQSIKTEVSKKSISPTRLQTVAREEVIRVANGQITTDILVNRYVSTGEGKQTNSLQKVCISSDGFATVEQATGNTCSNEKAIDKAPENKYYTSFQIDETKKSNISVDVTVGNEKKYYQTGESCSYGINNKYNCLLDIREDSNVTKLGNNQFLGDKLTVGIHFQIDNTLISSIVIYDNGNANAISLSNPDEPIIIKNKPDRSVEVHNLEGKITLKNGQTATCTMTVELISTVCPQVACKISKIDSKLYKITSTGSVDAVNFYTFTSNHISPTATELTSGGSNPYSYMKLVVPSVAGAISTTENKTETGSIRYIRLDNSLKTDEILYGFVSTNNKACNSSCYIYGDDTKDEKKSDCKLKFKSAQTKEIKEYCDSNWQKDINGYTDSDDCFKSCSIDSTINQCNDIKAIEAYCENPERLGYTGEYAKQICINNNSCPDSDGYLFRSVNVLDPFPNSNESVEPFEKGNRVVGKNWRQMSELITNDSNDGTTITGDKANTAAEYVIDLTVSDIKSIRKNTKESASTLSGNKRTVYAKLNRVTTSGKQALEAYKSEFLRSTYSNLFQPGHGSDMPATFNPGNN